MRARLYLHGDGNARRTQVEKGIFSILNTKKSRKIPKISKQI
jgi:hypothetical protein